MNQRIRELAGRALDKVVPYTWTTLDHDEIQKLQEYFAELIVRECAGVYDKIDNGNLHMGTDDYLLALQKHFGVEE